ncbi:MAG: FitA-like ribbon-helix-helix domain-containing protein [Burkholderiales bacterium]
MGQVIVRNLDDETIGALKTRAAMHGNSLEQELRGILARAAKPGPKERLALADEIRAMTPKKRQSNSTALIREDRER